MASKVYDVLIIGGGPAGLGAATGLARQLYSALVLDSGEYRNAIAKHMHNVPGFDHVDPAEFRAKARSDLQKRYPSIEFRSATVKDARKLDSGLFEAVDEQGVTYSGKKLVLATGIRDLVKEETAGYKECWGRGIFHCLFCHGYEERGAESSGTLASGNMVAADVVAHVALMAKRLSKGVTVYTSGRADLAEEIKAKIHSSKVMYDDRVITKFELQGGGPGVVVTFADGTTKTEGFIASQPRFEQRAPFIEQLGLELTPMGDIKVNPPFNATNVPGCFAAGDAATMMKAAMQAMTMGGFAAAGAVFSLQAELDAKDEL